MQKKGKKVKKEKLRMLSTLREKRHYLVLMVQGKTKARAQDVKSKINEAIIDFIGVLGYAKAGVLFVERGKVNAKDVRLYFIISVTTKYVDHVKAALTLIKKPRVRCIGVSGTLKKAREKFLTSLIKI